MSQRPLFHHGPPDTSRYPQWLQHELQARTTQGRSTRWTHCRRCHQLTITGDDARTMALTVHADPHPLTPQQHMQAILDRTLIYLAAPTQHPYRWNLHRLWPGHAWHQYTGAVLLAPHDCHTHRTGHSLADEPDPTPPHPDTPLPF